MKFCIVLGLIVLLLIVLGFGKNMKKNKFLCSYLLKNNESNNNNNNN